MTKRKNIFTHPNRELLMEIIEEATEALGKCDAGGEEQYAFELVVDHDELIKARDLIFDLNTRITDEIGTDDWQPDAEYSAQYAHAAGYPD